MKKVINSLTKKDSNKLGKRKRENEWLKIEFKSKMNPVDLKAFAKDIIESTGERRESLYLPSFASSLSSILSMDHGIPAGDFASMGVCVVGSGEDDHWKSGIHTQMLKSAMKHDIPIATMCLEVDHEETINRVINIIKNQEPPTVFKPYMHQIENEFYKQIEKYGVESDKNNDKDHSTFHGPIFDHDLIPMSCSKNNDEVNNEIFLRARNVGKSIVYPNILIPVKVTK